LQLQGRKQSASPRRKGQRLHNGKDGAKRSLKQNIGNTKTQRVAKGKPGGTLPMTKTVSEGRNLKEKIRACRLVEQVAV